MGEVLASVGRISTRTQVSPTPVDSTQRANPALVAGPLMAGPRRQRCVIPATRVLKFGGSSLATPDRIRDVARIIMESLNGGPVVVVVSAFQGVTDDLLECARLAQRQDNQFTRGYLPSPSSGDPHDVHGVCVGQARRVGG